MKKKFEFLCFCFFFLSISWKRYPFYTHRSGEEGDFMKEVLWISFQFHEYCIKMAATSRGYWTGTLLKFAKAWPPEMCCSRADIRLLVCIAAWNGKKERIKSYSNRRHVNHIVNGQREEKKKKLIWPMFFFFCCKGFLHGNFLICNWSNLIYRNSKVYSMKMIHEQQSEGKKIFIWHHAIYW